MTRGAEATRRGKTADEFGVFLNIPYDKRFSGLCLAYVAGLACFGLRARTALEIPGSERRLDRILELIRTCRYSIHDLSRVQIDRRPPPTPRFNVPFELGLAVAIAKADSRKRRDTWFVMESVTRRTQKSLSDLDGTEVYVHGGSPEGVFQQLVNAFIRSARQPTVDDMQIVFDRLKRSAPAIRKNAGASNLFSTRVFSDLVVVARRLADRNVTA